MVTGSFISPNYDETFRYGGKAGETARAGEVWCLTGDLGAGKTAFARGFAQGLGYKGKVTSPTFSLQNIYAGRLELYHFDWYRLERASEVEDLGWRDWTGRGGVVLVEWGDKFPKLFPASSIKLSFEFVSQDERRLTLEASHPDGADRAQELLKCWPP